VSYFLTLDEQQKAACYEKPTTWWFPSVPGRGHRPKSDAIALQICSRCPFLIRCRDYAMENRIRYGIWGGLTEYQRRMLRDTGRMTLNGKEVMTFERPRRRRTTP